jgi:hypothetical protein
MGYSLAEIETHIDFSAFAADVDLGGAALGEFARLLSTVSDLDDGSNSCV